MDATQLMFMVEVTYTGMHTTAFRSQLPLQRTRINQLMDMGTIRSMAVSVEEGRGWYVVKADSEEAVDAVMEQLPLAVFMKYEMTALTFYDANAFERTQLILN